MKNLYIAGSLFNEAEVNQRIKEGNCEEEVKTVDCECYDCGNFEKVGIDLLGKRCIKCNGRLIPI